MQPEIRNAPPASALDEDTFEFANTVFDLARAGHSETLGALLGKGLPPNLRDHRGDSLLMLAAYHGHLETVRVLLRHRSDPGSAQQQRTDAAGRRRPSRAICR